MNLSGKRTLPVYIVTVLTALAMVISFSFSAAEAMNVNNRSAVQTGAITGENCFLSPFEAGEIPLFTTNNDSDNSYIKRDLQRVQYTRGLSEADYTTGISQFRTNLSYCPVSDKVSILLNLRI